MTAYRKVAASGDSPAGGIGTRIRELRLEQSMSQKELVGEKFSKSYISSIERGKIKPSLKALEYLASRLGVDITTLFSEHRLANGEISPKPIYDAPAASATTIQENLALQTASLLLAQNQVVEARQILENQLKVRSLGTEKQLEYYLTLTQITLQQNQLSQAHEALNRARELADKLAAPVAQVQVNLAFANLHLQERKPLLALEQLGTARQLLEKAGLVNTPLWNEVILQLASITRQLGDDRAALELIMEQADLTVETPTLTNQADGLFRLASHLTEDGSFVLASQYATNAQSLYSYIAYLRLTARALLESAESLTDARRYPEAEQLLHRATQFASLINDIQLVVLAQIGWLNLWLEKADLDRARQVVSILPNPTTLTELAVTPVTSPVITAQLLAALAGFNLADNQTHTALDLFAQAVKELEQAQNNTPNFAIRTVLSKIYIRYARALTQAGKATQAGEMYEAAYRLREGSR